MVTHGVILFRKLFRQSIFFVKRSLCLQEQLRFVYDTLEEYVICGKTWFPVSELSSLLKHKSTKDPHTKINEYQKEFLVSNLLHQRT